MTDATHPNHVEHYSVSVEDLEKLFARSNEQAVADNEARQRAAAWPHNVEQSLLAAANRIRALDSRVDALESRRG